MNTKLHGFLEPHQEKGYAVLRIMAGWMFAFHGVQKIFGVLSKYPQPEIGSQLWIGGMIELVAGIAIAIGLFTTVSAFVASGTMAVAYFQFHWKFQFNEAFFPTVNQGELAVIYSFLFLLFAMKGAGIWSVESALGWVKQRKSEPKGAVAHQAA